ncbi:MAG TPA: ComEC/Rec2 family competence protein [Candidatus Babeliales bacterium]|jgi:competence protein ComEC|nr:ComEC/Rec2 family competence protein [Candidatus Babeliales bacterium]
MIHLLTNNFYFINISPLFLITLFFIIGITFHTLLIPLLIIFATIALCTLLFRNSQHHTLLKQLIICSLFSCIGAWLHHKELRDYNDFYTFVHNKKITVTGAVIDKSETVQQFKKITVLTIAIDTIAIDQQIQTNSKIMLLYTKNNNISVGDNVAFYNICCKKPSSESFQQYQIKEQVVATIFDNAPQYTIDHHPTWSLRYWIWSQKKRLLDTLANKLSPHTFRFFSSLFLGNRACVKASLEETNEQFKIWGISHFLARSGLHLALFILIWHTIFCCIPIPLIIKQLMITLLSCIYFILTWTSAPFTRSFALFIINKICLFTKTSFHLLHYVTLVCLCFLLYSPLYLFFLDFQLSFALTFALAWFNQLSTQYEFK